MILDQLELPLDIPPLSEEEKVERWLEEDTTETEESFVAALFLVDGESRGRRATRCLELREVQARFARYEHIMTTGGDEAIWLYEEAGFAYVEGLFVAALLCAHAACERVVAGALFAYRESLDKNWERWGLGSLTKAALALGMIDEGLRARLDEVTERRKVTAHFREYPNLEGTVIMRATQLAGQRPIADGDVHPVHQLLQDDALFAVTVASEVVRADLWGGLP